MEMETDLHHKDTHFFRLIWEIEQLEEQWETVEE